MMQLDCWKAGGGGVKWKDLKASVVKTEPSESENVIIFPAYPDYSLKAATAAYKPHSRCRMEKCMKTGSEM